jgi:tetratricopeptide (TPR) repeat protein
MTAMRSLVLSVILLAASVGSVTAATPAQPPHPAGDLADATAAYLRDPAGAASAFIEAARRHSGELNAAHVLLLSDAALRTGQAAVARDLALDLQRGAVDPAMSGMLELMLAWTALARGRFAEASARLENAGTLNPALGPVADPALGLVASARGQRDGPALLAVAAARPDLDPAWREVAPLLEAYARYWQGDMPGAADAFTAFAAANPNSRFADDAVYAAARAKRRDGRTAEAEADLLALAGDGPTPTGVPHRLLALDARAVLREGMRRDRDLRLRTPGRRFADLLDGDGVVLARAALAARRRSHAAAPDEAVATGAIADDADHRLDGVRGGTASTSAAAPARSGATPAASSRRLPGQKATAPPTDTSAGASPIGWRWLGVAALLLALVLRWVARRRPGAA